MSVLKNYCWHLGLLGLGLFGVTFAALTGIRWYLFVVWAVIFAMWIAAVAMRKKSLAFRRETAEIEQETQEMLDRLWREFREDFYG